MKTLQRGSFTFSGRGESAGSEQKKAGESATHSYASQPTGYEAPPLRTLERPLNDFAGGFCSQLRQPTDVQTEEGPKTESGDVRSVGSPANTFPGANGTQGEPAAAFGAAHETRTGSKLTGGSKLAPAGASEQANALESDADSGSPVSNVSGGVDSDTLASIDTERDAGTLRRGKSAASNEAFTGGHSGFSGLNGCNSHPLASSLCLQCHRPSNQAFCDSICRHMYSLTAWGEGRFELLKGNSPLLSKISGSSLLLEQSRLRTALETKIPGLPLSDCELRGEK